MWWSGCTPAPIAVNVAPPSTDIFTPLDDPPTITRFSFSGSTQIALSYQPWMPSTAGCDSSVQLAPPLVDLKTWPPFASSWRNQLPVDAEYASSTRWPPRVTRVHVAPRSVE